MPNALSRKMMQRIVNVQYDFPPSCQPSYEARDLLSRIFVQDPVQVRYQQASATCHSPQLLTDSLHFRTGVQTA